MKLIWKAAGILLTTAVLATGCQGSKEKYVFRETGIEQLNAGQYEEAFRSLEQALAHSDKKVGTFELDVLKYRAEAEYKLEDYEAAANTYGILQQLEKENTDYIRLQCMLFIKAERLDDAVEEYKNYDEEKPDAPETEEILMALGQALIEADRFDEALVLYQNALDGGSQSAELYNRMGLCQLDAGNYDRALEYFEQGVQTGEADVQPRLLYNKAAAYEQKLDFAKALELLESYVAVYGPTEEIEKEIAFLKTR